MLLHWPKKKPPQLTASLVFCPPDQAQVFRTIWDEFEANETPEAKFAKSIDRLQPPMQNLASGGGSWTDYKVTQNMFETRIGPKINDGAPKIWAWLQPRVAEFFARS